MKCFLYKLTFSSGLHWNYVLCGIMNNDKDLFAICVNFSLLRSFYTHFTKKSRPRLQKPETTSFLSSKRDTRRY